MKQLIQGEEITVEIDLDNGARLSSVKWDGREFSVQRRDNPLWWGWYPMVPWAGRILNGKLRRANGDEVQLPTDVIPPHAIHGFGFQMQWRDLGNGVSRVDFTGAYQGASAELRVTVDKNVLNYELEYIPGTCDLPGWVGIHTWFPRWIGDDAQKAEVIFDAEKQLAVDETLMPNGDFLPALTPQPWDDVFYKPKGTPTALWKGGARLEVTSPTPWWVVYTLDSEGVCIEPQTSPPNSQNLAAKLGLDLNKAHLLQAKFTFLKD